MSIYFAAATMVMSFVAGACYLIVNGHPWFGGFALLTAALIQVKRS